MADLTARSAPLYTAEVWAQELRSLNARRVLLVLWALALNALFVVLNVGQPTRVVIGWYLLWLVLIAAVTQWSRVTATAEGQMRLLTGSFVVDTAIITLLMYANGGGWWLGAIFHGIIIAVATLTLPPSASRWILWVALVGWSALILPLAFGWLDPAPWYGLPRVDGAFTLLGRQYGLGVLALVAIHRLVRAQVKRTDAVNASTRRVLDAAPNAIFVLDRDGRVRVANEASQRQLGFPSDALVGRGLIRFVPSTDHARVRAMFTRALGGEIVTFEHAMQRSDGSVRWISVSYAPMVQPTGDTAVIAIARDLTDEREAAAEREALQQEVARTRRLESIGRLVSGVAHELNNPLTAVLSFTEQLLVDAPDGATREALTVVQQQAERARSVVRDLLQVVRDGGQRERVTVALPELLTGSARAFAPAAQAAGVTIDVSIRNAGPLARLDATGIGQVIDNLVSNALLATPRGGTIRMSLEFAVGSGWRIDVADTGAGLSDAVMPHVFEPFFTTRPVGAGTGLGLSVSRGIVEQHGGTIRVANGAAGSGLGAIFTVQLPETLAATATESSVDAAERLAVSSSPAPLRVPSVPLDADRARHVLLIDDEAAIRQALERFLTRRGCTVELCDSASDAVTRLREESAWSRIDAIVSDVKMPGMTGLDFYRVLERDNPSWIDRLMLVTGDVASPEVASALGAVRCPVLEKPFALQALSATLDEIFARTPRVSIADVR